MKSGKWTHIQRRRRPSYLRFRHTPPPRQVGIPRNQLDDRIGRWLSNDPIGISGGLNQYVFCYDNPVNYVDPSGLKTAEITVIEVVGTVVWTTPYQPGSLPQDESILIMKPKPKDWEAELKAGDPIYAVGTITTENGSRVKLKLPDGSIVSMGERSELCLSSLIDYDDIPAGVMEAVKEAVGNAAKGFFGAITRQIVKLNPNGFKIKVRNGGGGIRN